VVLGRSASDSPVSASSIFEPVSVVYDGQRLFVGDAALHRVLVWNSLPTSDNQPADAVLGQATFTSVNVSETPRPDTISRPTALASDGTNLFVADEVDHRILVFSPGDAPLANDSVVNSASLMKGPLAPGTLVTISAAGLTQDSVSAPDGEALPNKLGGFEVFINGEQVPLLSVSPTETRAQLPYGLEGSSASLYLRVIKPDGQVITTIPATVPLLPAVPGLFAFGGAEPRNAMILHVNAATGEASAPVTAQSPAHPGEVLAVWAAGLGNVNSPDSENAVVAGQPFANPDAPVAETVNATVAGQVADVVAANLPKGSIGIYEVRIQLPSDLPSDAKTPLLITQNGNFSNTVTVPVEAVVH